MKRNWNVVRKILELVEEGKLKDYIEEKRYRDEFSINSPDDGAPNELLGHFEILVDAGILKHCEIQRDENGKFVYWDLRGIFITMQGHDLIRCHTNFRHPFNLSWSGKTCDIRRSSKTTS